MTYAKIEVHKLRQVAFNLVKMMSEIEHLGISKYECNYLTQLIRESKNLLDSDKGETIDE